MKDRINQLYEQFKKEIEEICEYVYDHPEDGNQEIQSSQYLVEVLRKYGFQVEYPYLGLPTAFRAEMKCNEGKKVAFLAEYDALPGYGICHNEMAHACGHNWIAASTLGSAIVLSQLKKEFPGTIVVIGTPAEETTGGKCELVRNGAFQDIDGVIQMHLAGKTNIQVNIQAMDSLEFQFQGVPAHYASHPEEGVNALDGVTLMMMGTNALMKHLRKDASVAPIITEGGSACNIVPDHCTIRYYIRAKDRDYLETITSKVINCAKGASLMSGCKMEYHNFENSFDDLIYDEKLRSLLKKNLMELGVTDFYDPQEKMGGSSDIGNVSHVVPTVYCELSVGKEVYCHSEEFLAFVHGNEAKRTLETAVRAMAMTAYEYAKTGK